MAKVKLEDFQRVVQNERLIGISPILKHAPPDALFALWQSIEGVGALPKEAIFALGATLAIGKQIKESEK